MKTLTILIFTIALFSCNDNRYVQRDYYCQLDFDSPVVVSSIEKIEGLVGYKKTCRIAFESQTCKIIDTCSKYQINDSLTIVLVKKEK